MFSAQSNIFYTASEVNGRSITSVRNFVRSIMQAASRAQRTMNRADFIRQIVTWFKDCADGFIAPQLADSATQNNHEEFLTAVVTASVLLIPDSNDLVNRVACFCNNQIFDTLIIKVDSNQFNVHLSTAVQQAFLNAAGMSQQYSFAEQREAFFGQVQIPDVGEGLVRTLTLTTISREEWQLIATWMGFPQILSETSIPSQWQQVICEVFRQLRVDIQPRISVTTTTLSSQDVAHELLRLRDDSSHGQTVRSSGSTTGSGQDEGSFSMSRRSFQDIQIVNEREIG